MKYGKQRNETRLTVVHKKDGRVCEYWDVEISELIQDDGRTLKIIVE